ncbi:MAG: exodeoxyribonuclease VII small subunit [Lachnospiraceae bacterium]|nr:exodeoxyribonuclease VII small subunit [Lachnospiraceae bacterium]
MAKKEKELSLEEIFLALEKTLEELEDEEVSLEKSFAAYEKGMEMIKKANAKIDRVEKQVLAINQQGELEAFDAEDPED